MKIVKMLMISCLALAIYSPAAAAEDAPAAEPVKAVEPVKVEAVKASEAIKALEPIKAPSKENETGSTRVGGNLKLYLLDKTSGLSNTDYKSQAALSGLSGFYLYISSELSDKVSIEVNPKISVSASATPKLGHAISADLNTSPTASVGFESAYLKYKLPENMELSVGALRTSFTEDYGPALWYEEEFFGNAQSSSGTGGTLDDFGIELYRNFEVGPVTLPVYAYLLGGAGSMYIDNDDSRAVMLHVTPQIGIFKFMGSVYTGKWQDAAGSTAARLAGGLGFETDGFMFRTEYTVGQWDNKSVYANTILTDTTKTVQSNTQNGYYIKAGYRFCPEVRFILSLAHYDRNFSSVDKRLTTTQTGVLPASTITATSLKETGVVETYTRLSPIINLFVTPEQIIFLQYDYTINSREGDNAKLEYNRFTVGLRTTF